MRKQLAAAFLALVLAATAAHAQVPTQGLPARFIAAVAGAGVEASAILGEFCKTATVSGNTLTITCQADDETDYVRTFTAGTGGSGASITAGTADPTGGSEGDAYLQINASNALQSVWRRGSSTWTEYTIPTGSGAGEANVQVDWDETDSSADSFILNKPVVIEYVAAFPDQLVNGQLYFLTDTPETGWASSTESGPITTGLSGLAYRADGTLFALSRIGAIVYERDASTLQWVQGVSPPSGETQGGGLDVDSNGVVHIAGVGTDAVWSLSEGTWTRVVDNPSGEGFAAGLCVLDNDDILLLGGTNRQIYRTTNRSTWTTTSIGMPPSEGSPAGIDCDSLDDIWLYGEDTDAVWRYRNSAWEEWVDEPESFGAVGAIAVRSDGRITISEASGGRLQSHSAAPDARAGDVYEVSSGGTLSRIFRHSSAGDDVDEITLTRNGGDITATLGRLTGTDLTATVADEFVETLTFARSGQDLTVTLGRNVGSDLTATATLASGGASGTSYHAVHQDSVGGTASAITLRTGQSLSALEHGALFFFESRSANTGGVTVAVDDLTARTIVRSNGSGAATALTGGEITANDPVFIVYESRFGQFHWIPGHMGLMARRNDVTTDDVRDGTLATEDYSNGSVTEDKLADDAVSADKLADDAVSTGSILDGAVTEPKLAASVRNNLHGSTVSSQATYQVDGTVTSAFAGSQSNWLGNIFQANVDMVVYSGRAFVNRASGQGNANYQGHIFPVTRNSATDYRIATADDVFTDPPAQTRNRSTNSDFADEVSITAGSGLTELEFRTGQLAGLRVAEGDYFAVVVTSRSSGRSYVVSSLSSPPTEEPHVGSGDFPYAGFRWAAPFRDGTSIIGSGQNYYGSEATRVVRMQVDYAVEGASTFAGYDEGSEVYTGAAVIDCVGAGISCSNDTTDGRFRVTVTGGAAGTIDINALTNLPSNDISDDDNLLVGDISASDNKKATVGELAARLGDQSTITSSGGTLTADVVTDATMSYNAGLSRIDLSLDRETRADITAFALLPTANTVRTGLVRFATADETVTATDDDVAIAPSTLATYTANQGPATGYDLTYGINETATAVDNQNTRLIGNIYRAGTDATIYRWRAQADVATNQSRVYTARGFVVNRVSATSYQRGTNTLNSPPSRTDPGDAYTATSEVIGAEATVEAFLQTGFNVEAGDYFFLGFSHGSESQTYLVGASGAVEDTHTGHEDFPHGTVAYVAKGAASQEEPDATHEVFHNTTNAIRMSVDYEVADVLTGYEEGSAVYIGASALNCVGTGITCSEDTSGRLQLVVPGGGGSGGLDIGALTNLPSNDISDTDQFVLNDVSVPENKRATVGEVAARMADGTTITSGSGTLSAAFEDVPDDLLPDADNSGAVGNAGRTWADGQFTDLTVNTTLTAGGTVTTGGSITATGDIRTSSDVILNDSGQILLGTGRDVSFDYDGTGNELEIRLGADATAIRIYDGNGNDFPYEFTKDGTATFENLTVTGTLTADGIGGGGGGGSFSGALVDRSADVTVNGQLAAVSWNNEEFDEGGWHSTATGTRLTVPADVDYVRVSCSLRVENVQNGGQVLAQIRQNGSHLIGLPQQTGLTASPSTSVDLSVTSAVVEVDQNDYFECLKQSNDNSLTIATESWFGIVAVSGGGGSGGTDLENIDGDVLPDSDDSGNVGTAARTWAGGRFDSLTVDTQFDVAGHSILAGGIEINGDITAINDIVLGDGDQLIFGDGTDGTFDYDGTTNDFELRLGTDAIATVFYDGTGTTDTHTFNKNGTTILGGNVTARGNLLPNTDGGHSVGTSARTWGSGHFTDLTVDDEFRRGGALQLSVVCTTQADYDALTTPNASTVYIISATCP